MSSDYVVKVLQCFLQMLKFYNVSFIVQNECFSVELDALQRHVGLPRDVV